MSRPSTGVSRTDAALARLTRAQARRPLLFIAAAFAVALCGGGLARRMELKPRLEELLPERQPSVVELHRLHDRVGRATLISVVIEGDVRSSVRGAGEELVRQLTARRPSWLVDAATGVHAERAFLLPRAGLFLERQELAGLLRELEATRAEAVLDAVGLSLGIADEGDVRGLLERLPARLLSATGRAELAERWPGGWFESRDGRTLVVLLRTSVPMGELERAREALADVDRTVQGIRARPAMGALRIGYAGDLVTGLSEYGAIQGDLVRVGALGLALILAVLGLFFGSVRILAVLGLGIGVGLAVTFGLTALAIGQLDIATAFMVSIVAGNGINTGIVLVSRYLEARRDGLFGEAALLLVARSTWLPTFGASIAAAAAYGSLAVSGLRGLEHFAFVGATGMLSCWLAIWLVMPPLLVLVERGEARRRSTAVWGVAVRGDAFAGFLIRRHRALALLAVAASSWGLWGAVAYISRLPIENDMRRLENDVGDAAERARLSAKAREILGVNLESSMTILADRVDQVLPLKRALEARRDAAPADARPFEAIHTLFDYVAPDQESRLPLLLRLGGEVRKARAAGMVDDHTWERVVEILPPPDLVAYGIDDLPRELARSFEERDGTRGRLVHVEPTAGEDDNDLRYLLRWTAAFRETRLPSGERLHGSGRALIFADMLEALLQGMPRALLLSLALTIASVVVTLRRWRFVAPVIGSLLLGVAWLASLLLLLDVRLNFLNLVAIPVTFGIGVDYALNILQRHAAGDGIRAALAGTGPAVVVCSLTTILGYLALLRSVNRAVRSLGLLAVLGEVCCLFAAVAAVPALLVWWERRRHPQ